MQTVPGGLLVGARSTTSAGNVRYSATFPGPRGIWGGEDERCKRFWGGRGRYANEHISPKGQGIASIEAICHPFMAKVLTGQHGF